MNSAFWKRLTKTRK